MQINFNAVADTFLGKFLAAAIFLDKANLVQMDFTKLGLTIKLNDTEIDSITLLQNFEMAIANEATEVKDARRMLLEVSAGGGAVAAPAAAPAPVPPAANLEALKALKDTVGKAVAELSVLRRTVDQKHIDMADACSQVMASALATEARARVRDTAVAYKPNSEALVASVTKELTKAVAQLTALGVA